MERRKFFIGFVGGLAAAPALIVMASSVEAAPLPEALPAGASAPTEPIWGRSKRTRLRPRVVSHAGLPGV